MSPEIQQPLQNGIRAIRIAYVYMRRIDRLISGDDGDDNFLKRLKAGLKREAAGCEDADLSI